MAAEAERVERTRRKTWSRARSEVLVPYRVHGLYLHKRLGHISAISSGSLPGGAKVSQVDHGPGNRAEQIR